MNNQTQNYQQNTNVTTIPSFFNTGWESAFASQTHYKNIPTNGQITYYIDILGILSKFTIALNKYKNQLFIKLSFRAEKCHTQQHFVIEGSPA